MLCQIGNMRYSRTALYGGILDADFKHIVKIRSNSNNYKSRIRYKNTEFFPNRSPYNYTRKCSTTVMRTLWLIQYFKCIFWTWICINNGFDFRLTFTLITSLYRAYNTCCKGFYYVIFNVLFFCSNQCLNLNIFWGLNIVVDDYKCTKTIVPIIMKFPDKYFIQTQLSEFRIWTNILCY